MADQGGISKLGGSIIAPLPGKSSIDSTKPSDKRTGSAIATQGSGRREVPDSASRQWVNLDGKQMSRTAPRGTYLNLLV
jgi:hypothetical protein